MHLVEWFVITSLLVLFVLLLGLVLFIRLPVVLPSPVPPL
jgi:hypothetical protein